MGWEEFIEIDVGGACEPIEIDVGGRFELIGIDAGGIGEFIIGIVVGGWGEVMDVGSWGEPIKNVCWGEYIGTEVPIETTLGCEISVFGVNWDIGVIGVVNDWETEIASFVLAGSIIGAPYAAGMVNCGIALGAGILPMVLVGIWIFEIVLWGLV